MYLKRVLIFCVLIVTCTSCNDKDTFVKKKTKAKTLFSLVPSETSQINFSNNIEQNDNFNCLSYTYALIGGGVAVGDINNDGLQDVYFTSNQNSNKLYLNKGNFVFEDITEKSGTTDSIGWSTGTSVVDINNDGWLDIYVCKSASIESSELRKNRLYINQKDGTFKEDAKSWGLDHNGFSIQSYFFDYDKDGDLDMYLVNHRYDFENTLRIEKRENQKFYPETSDHLFRNDGNQFVNVTQQAKLINKAWGLSASIGDFNNDSWPDIYVSNDYIIPDMLYINNKDGTFSNQIQTRFKHISYNSMGSDFADINNDFLPDLMVLEMSAEDHVRSKENMATMDTDGFQKIVNANYHYPYMANVLQLNNGNGSFSDIGQLGGISKTDWSWAPLIADFDNDGFKDIIVTNGIERNFGNQDYPRQVKANLDNNVAMTKMEVIEMIPSEKIENYSYKNNGDLTFTNSTKDWGLNQKLNSNGIAYADFDNDGDLDIVINNMSDQAVLYKNNSVGNYISIELNGHEKNKIAIGAKVKVLSSKKQQYQELYLARGYQSSVTNILNFGLGDEETVNTIEVIWDNGKISKLEKVIANQKITINIKDAGSFQKTKAIVNRNLKPIKSKRLGIDFKHSETEYDDFSKQVLLPQKQTQKGPTMAVADINGDGLEDFFIGGAENQASCLYIQNKIGGFEKREVSSFVRDKNYEDLGSLFFDADNDGDLDLYVTSGGYHLSKNSELLQDRLYINSGKDNFIRSNQLPKILSSSKSVLAFDFDDDGDHDIFVGGHTKPAQYPLASNSYILENQNGRFKDVTKNIAKDFMDVGIVNDMIMSDFDNDGQNDIIIVGEWMSITVFKNYNGTFKKLNVPEFQDTSGWWNTIKAVDVDNDGDQDYLVGNLGGNNKFKPTKENPLHIYGYDFDDNGSYDMVLSKTYKGRLVPVRGKECSTQQNTFVSEKMETYKEFANSSLVDIYGDEALEYAYHKKAYEFNSVLLKNNNGNFKVEKLPSIAQLGPTMGFEFTDINKDGITDFIGVGAIHETEVETIRYDANIGYVLIGEENGELKPYKDLNFYNGKNTKGIRKLNINNKEFFFLLNNDENLTIYVNR